MKMLLLIFTLLFSYSVLADCCNSVEFDDCKTELLKSAGSHSDSTENEHEACHCTFSCGPKILKKTTIVLSNDSVVKASDFPRYLNLFKNFDPSPLLHPPIS